MSSWQEAIQHDGYFVVRLHVFTVEEGGQNRHVQSGMKASWTGPGHELLPGLLELPSSTVRSIAPGTETIVHVWPLEDGTMPCDGAWPEIKVKAFRRWVEGGTRPWLANPASG